MKKLLALSLLCAVLPASAQSQSVMTSNTATVFVNTVCIKGYLFAVATVGKSDTNNGSGGVALTQVMRYIVDYRPPQPVTCREGTQPNEVPK